MQDLDLRLEALSAIVGCPVKSLEEFRRKYPGAPDPPLLQLQDVVDMATGVTSMEELIAEVRNHLESLSAIGGRTRVEASHEELENVVTSSPEASISRWTIWQRISLMAAHRARIRQEGSEAAFPTDTEVQTEDEVATEGKLLNEAAVTTENGVPTEAKHLNEATGITEPTFLTEIKTIPTEGEVPPETKVTNEPEVPTETEVSTETKPLTEAKVLTQDEVPAAARATDPPLLPQQDLLDAATGTKSEAYLLKVDNMSNLLNFSGARTEDGVSTAAGALRKQFFVNEEDFFDPRYDYDFTHIKDRLSWFKRGGEQYRRPCGWNRLALKVLGKYKGGDGWLGVGADAWPVSYHGTTEKGASGIIQTHYKAGPRQVYGRGVYSTPDLRTAASYTKKFTSEKTKKTYEVILQNRINPKNREQRGLNYWLVRVPEGSSVDKEKLITENSIRPYGILLREVS